MAGGLMGWAVPPEQGWRKGPWTPQEDNLLTQYVTLHGEGRWSSVARSSGLNRSGKSCRLRWVNYLRPGLKRGQITPQEEGIIIELHALWGNKWSTIARYLPGRTDNEIKNYWRTHFKKERSARKISERQKSQNPKPKPQQQQVEETNRSPMELASSTLEEENLMIPAPSWMDTTCQDQNGLLWGNNFWNFSDQAQAGKVMDQMQQDQYCCKMALSLQNQTSTNNNNNFNFNNLFSLGGDPNNWYNNEGYSF